MDEPVEQPAVEAETPAPAKRAKKEPVAAVETEIAVAAEPPCALPGPLELGESSAAVTVLQNALASASLLAGRDRGTYDLATQQAVQMLQRRAREHGYDGPINGLWDDATRRAGCRLLQ